MNGELVGQGRESWRNPLDPINEECRVAKARTPCSPRAGGKGVRAGIDSDGERGRLGPRAVEDVAAITRTHVHKNAGERGG